MAVSRGVRVRRIVEDVVFYGATAGLAWWAMDRSPPWVMVVSIAGALALAVIARRLLVRIRARQDRADQ